MIIQTSIRQQARQVSVLFAGVLAVIAAAALFSAWSGIKASLNLEGILLRTEMLLYPLVDKTRQVEIDIAHVQQFIQDISATRGQDGLDDGLKRAQEAANNFKKHRTEAVELAQQLDQPEIIRILDAADKDFTTYFQAGRAMAEAYIAKGPAGGNPLMKDFDTKSEHLQKDIQKIYDVINRLVSENTSNVTAASSAAHWMSGISIILVILSLVAGIVVAMLVSRGMSAIANLLARAADVMAHAAKGDLNARITRINRYDELGALLNNANRVLDLTESFAKEAGAAMLATGRKEYYRTIPEEGMRGEFLTYVKHINDVIRSTEARDAETIRFSDEHVVSIVDIVADKTLVLRENAQTLMDISHQAIERTMLVASAAEEATSNVQTVASAAVELTASIAEINRQIGESSRLADDAVNEVNKTNATVEGLNAAAQKIGAVVKLIQDIASQTNLLALNATIEAARAGDAGKGFAVVANEVKNLASQTARATEEITAQVTEMQNISSETVRAIEQIGSLIAHINSNVGGVANAVAAQDAATAEISRSVQEAATGTQDVSRNISVVATGAKETEEMAASVRTSADDLSHQAETLRLDVNAFVERIR